MPWEGSSKSVPAYPCPAKGKRRLTLSWQFMHSDSISSTGFTSSPSDWCAAPLVAGATWSACWPMDRKYSFGEMTLESLLCVWSEEDIVPFEPVSYWQWECRKRMGVWLAIKKFGGAAWPLLVSRNLGTMAG